MPEPNVTLLGGDTVGATLRRYFLATRPTFFTGSILSVVVGTAWGSAVAGGIDLISALLALAATVSVHAASNVINDVTDELNGTDRKNDERIYPFTGGSRFIQNGVLTTHQMTRWALMLFATGIVIGAVLIARNGVDVLYFGLAGVALGLLYSLPVVQLSGRGIGEITVAIAFGVVPVTGAAWLQSEVVDTASLLVSVPVGCYVAAILLINEVPDRHADAEVGKRTWPVRFGLHGTRWLYTGLHIAAVAAVGALVALDVFPPWLLTLPLVLLIGGVRAAATITSGDREALENGIRRTLAIHALGTVALAAIIVVTA